MHSPHESHNVARPSMGIGLSDRRAELMKVDVGECFTPPLLCPSHTVSWKRVGRMVCEVINISVCTRGNLGEISIGKQFGMVTFGALRNKIQPFNIIFMEIFYMFFAMTAFSWNTEGQDFLGRM